MPKNHMKLLDKPAKFWLKVHIIGYLMVFSSLGTYSLVNQITFNKKQKENPDKPLENGIVAKNTARDAMEAQALVGATVLFGGLAMWRKKEKQYE